MSYSVSAFYKCGTKVKPIDQGQGQIQNSRLLLIGYPHWGPRLNYPWPLSLLLLMHLTLKYSSKINLNCRKDAPRCQYKSPQSKSQATHCQPSSTCSRAISCWIFSSLTPSPPFQRCRGSTSHHLDSNQSWKAFEEPVGVTVVTTLSISETSILPSTGFQVDSEREFLLPFVIYPQREIRSHHKKLPFL